MRVPQLIIISSLYSSFRIGIAIIIVIVSAYGKRTRALQRGLDGGHRQHGSPTPMVCYPPPSWSVEVVRIGYVALYAY